MADITECPVCLDEYQEPKVLPCSHTLCKFCLETLPKSNKKGKLQLCCPICTTKHNLPNRGPTGFPNNQAMEQLIANNQVRIVDKSPKLYLQSGCNARMAAQDVLLYMWRRAVHPALWVDPIA